MAAGAFVARKAVTEGLKAAAKAATKEAIEQTTGIPTDVGDIGKAAKKGENLVKAVKKAPHGNIAGNQPATLYKKVGKYGELRKWGITQHADPRKRYTRKQIGEGDVIRIERGPRKEMLKKERELVETQPGPENREPWAGKRMENKSE